MRSSAPYAVVVALALALSGAALAHEGRRHVDKHSHGEGTLAVAIEGNRIEMRLEAPASDVVGFEHAAKTAAQRKQLAAATDRLKKADDLFSVPKDAGCNLATSNVELIGAAAEQAKASNAGKNHDHAQKSSGQAPHASSSHSEVHATYALDCAAIAKVTSISFGYFKAFAGADKLIVTVIGSKGQSQFTVTRKKPVIDLGGSS